jgi:hypothetical protein
MIQRCNNFFDSHMAQQMGAVAQVWEETRQAAVNLGIAKLATLPREGLAELRSLGHGCRWLLGRWSEYQKALVTYGYWPTPVWRNVVRVLGCDANPERIADGGARVLLAVVYNLLCHPAPNEELITTLLAPERRPLELRGDELARALPAPAAARTWLQTFVAEQINELQQLELSLRLGKDRADLERLLEQASLPGETAASRVYVRYHGESCSRFLRTIDKLPKELDRAASGFYDDLRAAVGIDDEGNDDEPPPDPPDQTLFPGESPGAPPIPSESEPESNGDDQIGPEPSGAAGPDASELRDSPGSGLPAAVELPVDDAATRPDEPAFPDGPSRAFPAATEPPLDEAATDSDQPVFPDGPGRAVPSVIGIPHLVGDHAAPVRVASTGRDDATPVPHERAPPGPGRDSPQSRDGSPHAVP